MFQFNFVGKLLGPKGNSLKRLQEETMTKMAILGRGSMRDKQKVRNVLFNCNSEPKRIMITSNQRNQLTGHYHKWPSSLKIADNQTEMCWFNMKKT